MYFLARFVLKFPCICLASLSNSCAFRRRLLVFPRGSRLGLLPLSHIFSERSESCLFPGRLIFYLVIEVPEFFKGSSSKSSKYLRKGLAERFPRLGATAASTVRSAWEAWRRAGSPHSLRTFKQIRAQFTPSPAWKGTNKRKSKQQCIF